MIRCRVGDPSRVDPDNLRLVDVEGVEACRAVLGRVRDTRGMELVHLWFEHERWAGRDAEMLALGNAFRSGDRQLRVRSEMHFEPRELVRSRASEGLYWFEAYLPWVPEVGRADVRCVDTWGAVMELPDLVELSGLYYRGAVPNEWEGRADVVETFCNSAEIASPRFYPDAIVRVAKAADADAYAALTAEGFTAWGGQTLRVAGADPGTRRVWLESLGPVGVDALRAATALHAWSINVDEGHRYNQTECRIVQNWCNATGIVDSPSHYPDSWCVVIDASREAEIRARLDAGVYRAVSFHAWAYQIPTVYPAELVKAAVDPYGGRFDRTRDRQSR